MTPISTFLPSDWLLHGAVNQCHQSVLNFLQDR